MNIRIEKGVPFSQFYYAHYLKNNVKKQGNKNSPPRYPFGEMGVMDSFLIPDHFTEKRVGEFRATANLYGRRHDKKFIVMRDDNHQWRCWRTE